MQATKPRVPHILPNVRILIAFLLFALPAFSFAAITLSDTFTGADNSNPDPSKWVKDIGGASIGNASISSNQLKLATGAEWSGTVVYSSANFTNSGNYSINFTLGTKKGSSSYNGYNWNRIAFRNPVVPSRDGNYYMPQTTAALVVDVNSNTGTIDLCASPSNDYAICRSTAIYAGSTQFGTISHSFGDTDSHIFQLTYNADTGAATLNVYEPGGSLVGTISGTAPSGTRTGIGSSAKLDLYHGGYAQYYMFVDNVTVEQPGIAELSSPQISFVSPTPADGYNTTNTSLQINVSISEPSLNSFKFNWNGTNYTYYDGSLVLGLNFNNFAAIGDNSTNVKDISQKGYNATIKGNPTYSSDSKSGPASMLFDANGDYLSLPSTSDWDFGSGNFSIMFWMKSNNVAITQMLFTKSTGTGYSPFSAQMQTDGNLTFWASSAGASWDVASNVPIVTLTTGTWIHVSIVRAGNSIYTYKDGNLKSTIDATGKSLWANSANLTIAGLQYPSGTYTQYFNGYLDEFRIYKGRAFSQDEIRAEMKGGIYKLNSTQWYFETNQSNLSLGNYSYYSWANSTYGPGNSTGQRALSIALPVVLSVALNSPPAGATMISSPIALNWTPSNFASSPTCNASRNGTVIFSGVCTNGQACTTSNATSEGFYIWNVTCYSGAESLTSETRNFTLFFANSPAISFVSPTPADGYNTTNASVQINVSIIEQSLNAFKLNWNGTNYSYYDNSLVLALNLDNNPEIGESSTVAKDSSMYGNNGTGSGMSFPAGKFLNSGYFSGSSKISIPDSSSLDVSGPNQESTFELWAKTPSVPTGEYLRLMAKTDGGNNRAFELMYHGTLDQYIFESYDGTNTVSVLSPTGLDDNSWHHLVMVRSANPKFYVDGVDATVSPVGSGFSINFNNNQPMLLGVFYGTGYAYIGTIDEVRIWNRTLSADEVRQHYQSNLKKFNSTQWYFETNQSNLSAGSYAYYSWANNRYGLGNSTSTRDLIISPPFTSIVLQDTFTGADNSAPNPSKWAISSFGLSGPGNATIQSNQLKLSVPTTHAGTSAYSAQNLSNSGNYSINFTLGTKKGSSSYDDYNWNYIYYKNASSSVRDTVYYNLPVNVSSFMVSVNANLGAIRLCANNRSGGSAYCYGWGALSPNAIQIANFSHAFGDADSHVFNLAYNADNGLANLSMYEPAGTFVASASGTVPSYIRSEIGANAKLDFYHGGYAQYYMLVDNVTVDHPVSEPTSDASPPYMVLTSPSPGNRTPITTVTFTCDATDNIALSNATLYIWNASGSQIYSNTTPLSGTGNGTSWAYAFASRGNYSWNCLAYDNSSNSASAASNATLTIQKYAKLEIIIPANGSGISRGQDNAEDIYALVPNNMSIIAQITDNESGAGISGANCGLIINGASKWVATTNSTGYCAFSYNKSGDSFGAYNLTVNYSGLSTDYFGASTQGSSQYSLENWSMHLDIENYRAGGNTYYYVDDIAVVNVTVWRNGALANASNLSILLTNQLDQVFRALNLGDFTQTGTGTYKAQTTVPQSGWIRWKGTAMSTFSGQNGNATSGLHTDIEIRAAPTAALNFSVTGGDSQPFANAQITIYRQGPLKSEAIFNQTLGSGTQSVQKSIVQNDSNYDLEIKTPNSYSILISNFNLSAGLNFATQQANFTDAVPNQTRLMSAVLASNATNFLKSTLTFAKTFEPDKICMCQNWNFASSSCGGSWECNSTSAYEYSSNSTHFWFNVTHFTGYALGQSENENLTIWDETDSGMPYGNQMRYIIQNIKFFANYSNSSSQPITGATCQIWFSDSGWNAMNYNSTNLYEYTRSFSSGGSFDWNVTCNKSGQATLTANDTVLVNSTIAVILNSPADSAIVKSAVITYNWTPYGFPGDPSCNLTRNGSLVHISSCTNNEPCTFANTTANGYYIWNVTCNSGATTRTSSTRALTVNTLYHSTNVEGVLNMNITEISSISLPQNTISFGTVEITQTYDSYPNQFFVIKNDGNTIVDIEVNATNPFLSSNCTSLPCSAYQVKVGANSTTPYPSCSANPSKETYANMYGSSSGLLINDFNFVDNDDSANIYIKFRLPNDEPPGSKSSTVTFWAKSSGSYACD